MDNSQASLLLCTEKYRRKAEEIQLTRSGEIRDIKAEHIETAGRQLKLSDDGTENGGLMLYTSGTTNRPKVSPRQDYMAGVAREQ
jgi:acyl-coenzyme A synthetase/AMP-(fatty) acid ligase